MAFATLKVAVYGLKNRFVAANLDLKGALRLVFTMLLLVLKMVMTVRKVGGLARGGRTRMSGIRSAAVLRWTR